MPRPPKTCRRCSPPGILVRDDAPCYYAYRLTMGAHVQTGLVAAASVADYDSNRIRKHEFTRPDKEDDRVRQIEALNAQTGPVLLAYPASAPQTHLIDAIAQGTPAADVTADDGIRHQIWVLHGCRADRRDHGRLRRHAGALHRRRPPSLGRGLARGRRTRAAGTGVAPTAFLSVIFPHHQMKILDYNRVVKDLNGLEKSALVTRLATAFSVEDSPGRVHPARPGEFGMYLAGRWHKLTIKPELIPADPVASLDVSLLSEHLLAPVLGIADLRRDKRIDFVGGIRGLAELEKRVDSGEMAVAFALHPTRMDQLMAVADSNNVMPPKSTWFEPKLADGLVSHVLD